MKLNGDVESPLKIALIQKEFLPTASDILIIDIFKIIFICIFYFPNITISVNPPVQHQYFAAEMSCIRQSFLWGIPQIFRLFTFSLALVYCISTGKLVCIKDPLDKARGLELPLTHTVFLIQNHIVFTQNQSIEPTWKRKKFQFT